MKVAGVFQGTPIRGGHNRGVCVRLQPRNTHIYTHNSAQNSTSTQVTCLWFLQPTANFFSSPFSSSSSSFSLCLSTTFSRRMWGEGQKIRISLAKYVSTCLHIPDLYVEYSRPAVVGQRDLSLGGCSEGGRERILRLLLTPPSSNPRPWSLGNFDSISTRHPFLYFLSIIQNTR